MPVRLASTVVDSLAGAASTLHAPAAADFVIHEHRHPLEVFWLQIGAFTAEHALEMLECILWNLARL